ncbi:MAG: ATP-grasp domain-containing protein [Spirochaetes bacterium]|nr:ATP-grasp domain-containing protein [Spirochaetota bacterium]
MFWKKKTILQNNFFISIGGGINQIPLIEEAKKLSLLTIGVDRDICAAGMHKCDIRIQESIENYDEIYDKLKDFLIEGEISGVLTKSFGPAIKTASYIADKLNIPLFPFSKADNFINKEKMKIALKENKINSPAFMIYSNKNADLKKIKIPYPFVIKPVVGHAKKNVELISNSKGLDKYLKNLSVKNENYLIEKFIEGDEVIAIGIVSNGKFHLVEITDKIKSALPYFVDIMHVSPSKHNILWDEIQEIGQNIANSYEIINSPLIMELVISANNNIHLIETTPEFGGEFLSDILIPERTGYNIIQESIKSVINNNFSPPQVNKKIRKNVVVKYITGTDGTLLSFNPLKSKNSGIIFSRIFKDIGSNIRIPVSNHDRIGVIITKGNSVEEAIKNAEEAEALLSIRIGESGDFKKL